MVTVTKVKTAGDAPPAYESLEALDTSATQLEVAPPVSPSFSSGPVLPCASPVNFLGISRTNTSIKGTYALDLSIPPLPSVTPPKAPSGHPLNLRFNSTNGSIDVTATIVHDAKDGDPARIEASTTNGSIKVKVEDVGQRHFHLFASSTNGRITLLLPHTFRGPIYIKKMLGGTIFSPSMQPQLTTFSADGRDHKYFLGDYKTSGFVDDVSWSGDAVFVDVHNGRVKIGYIDEPEALNTNTCFWHRLFH